MSIQEVNVIRLQSVDLHPNADRLEIAKAGGYNCIVEKGMFKAGDLVAYIPCYSIVPWDTLVELDLEGKLSGPDKNIVRPKRFRGILSEGLLYPAKSFWKEGENVSRELGVTKWEPTLPTELKARCVGGCFDRTLGFDIKNIKKKNEIKDNEEVVITEKIHGTFMGVCIVPDSMRHPELENICIYSVGLGAKGIGISHFRPENAQNIYVRTFLSFSLQIRLQAAFAKLNKTVHLLGEVFGKSLQDLSYGYDVSKNETIGYRPFDIYIGDRENGNFLDYDEFLMYIKGMALKPVPQLYRGPYSDKIVKIHTDGKETISGLSQHIREGVVVKPTKERKDSEKNRIIYKSISADYLLRNGGTEYN